MVMKIHEMEMRAEGRAEGRNEKTVEVAKSMYDDGLGLDQIARILKLDIADVEVMLGLRKMA